MPTIPGSVSSGAGRIITFLGLALTCAAMSAAAQTRLWIQSDPGDSIGQGVTALYTSPSTAFTLTDNRPSRFAISMAGWSLVLTPPPGGTLGSGSYEAAISAAGSQGTAPGMSFSLGTQPMCATLTGRFVIRSVRYNPSGAISSLTADFEQHCMGNTPALWGELRFNSTAPLTIERPPGWTTPDNFDFGGALSVLPSTMVVSNSTTIYGINAPATISVVDGEYSKNGGPFTSADGSVVNRDAIRVRRISSAAPAAIVSATVIVAGSVAGGFALTTATSTGPQTGLVIQSYPGDLLANGQSLFLRAPDWTLNWTVIGSALYDVSVRGTGPGGDGFDFELFGPNNSPVSMGAWEEASETALGGVSPGLNFGMGFSGCGHVSGRYVVLEIDRVARKLAVDFEQLCDQSTQPLLGQLRVNSSVPFNFERAAGNSVPEPMAFTPQVALKAGSFAYSNQTRIIGTNAPVPISIAGGEYSLNGGAFTSVPGNATELDTVVVRVKAPTVPGGSRQALLDTGGIGTIFPVTTWAPGTAVTGLSYEGDPTNFYMGGTAPALFNGAMKLSVQSPYDNALSFDLKRNGNESYEVDFAAPNGALFTPGVYENAGPWPFQAPASPGFMFAGNGLECNQQSARFVVQEVVYDENGVLQRFAADFGVTCADPGQPNIRGEIRYASSVPLSVMLTANPPRDLSAEGRDDLLWRNADGRAAVWLMNGLTPSASGGILGPGTGWMATHFGDFDADGRTDIVWQHPDGRMAVWLMNGLVPASTQQLLNAGSGWTVTHVADLDGDGKADFVFRNIDGSVAVWTMNAAAVASGARILGPGTGWSVAKVADFDGDGNADLLWTHDDGRAAIWLMSGASVRATAQVLNAGSGWTPVQVADFDGDGKSDIVWRNGDGRIAIWLMNGTALKMGRDILGPGTGWSVIATADFDGNGKADLLFEHGDGRAAIWLMDGLVPAATSQILNAGSGWTVAATRDVDGDGRADIVWRNADGSYAIWLMNGAAMTNGAGILGTGTGWQIAP